MGLIQIDSVNVLVRSQELPLFARLGPHPRDLLPKAAADGELFEYWGHEASHIPVDQHHLFRWKMVRASEGSAWSGLVRMNKERPGYVESIYQAVVERGPVVAGDLSERIVAKGAWWDWDHAKQALEWLFWTGRITARRRPNDFARMYDLPERMLPARVLATPTPTEPEARKELMVLAARSLGVGTLRDLSNYHRQRIPICRPLLPELVEDGRLLPVQVEGWKEPAYLHPEAKLPRWVRGRALLSPFDSLIWERDRVERLFGFHYRVEIYTPAPKRKYGYYVLPFLLGDELVARVDLKADRAASTLLVRGAYAEPGVPDRPVAEELAAELVLMGAWLGLERVQVDKRGDLAPALRVVIGGTAG
ncbi:MAG TPA: crosslink repair DNA glycosylase YcaQ family protein [Acidimicrobiales bacterium]|nr:crosslink repair DNA glycosylase YcaQ family protein [Acidimicrobiales bacterium]